MLVVRCPYCGEAVRPDAQVCPRCQNPLSAQPGYVQPGYGYQPAEGNLPDWMRQMQAPSAAPFGSPDEYGPPAGPASVAGGSLINEDALPSWLRGGGAGAPPVGSFGQSNAGWAVPPVPPVPSYGQGAYPQGGYPQAPQQPWPQQAPAAGPANPFDEAALPAWLTQAAGESFAQPRSGSYGTGAYSTNQYPTGAYDGQQGFGTGTYTPGGPQAGYPSSAYPGTGGQAGASGFDNQGLPAWMNAPQAGAPGQEPFNARDGMPAASLIDEQSLPSWLRGGAGAAGQAGGRPGEEPLPSWLTQMTGGAQAFAPPASPQGGWQPAPAPPMGVASMPANQMVDDAALPDWLRAASAGASYTPGGIGAPQQAFSAGQLVDPNALPGWARDAGPNGAGQQGARAGNSDWLTDSRMPAAGRNGGVKSAWLRDNPPNNPIGTEEMPSWMRAERGQGGQGRQRSPRREAGDEMDTRARSVRSGRGRPRDYQDYDEQMMDDGAYEDEESQRSNGRKRGFFDFFRRR